jgi:glycosyltransferase involved in cell wall biosynthesis
VIYICIPALDEGHTVGVLLWKIRRVMAEFPRDYHLLVLDDGSTDDTRERLEPYTRVLPLTVLRNERTMGYAAALETLFREAVARSTHPKRDVVVVLQADFSESPDDIPALIRRIEGGADVVGTAVTGESPEPTRGERWARRLLPWLLPRAALPREARDALSGFRAYRVQMLRRALADAEGRPLLQRSGRAANAELLAAVAQHARRVEAAEVALRHDRRERGSRFEAWETARELWAFRRTARPLPPPAAPAPAGGPAAEAAPRPRRRGAKPDKDAADVS